MKHSDGAVPALPDHRLERRILILAPTGNDASLTAEVLKREKLVSEICGDVTTLAAEAARGCGVIILAEEVMMDKAIAVLLRALHNQPPWSDVPLVLITSGGEAGKEQLRRLGIFGGANVTLLERPFRRSTLLSLLDVALRARGRQYVARDSVAELKRAHAELEQALRAKDDFLAALSHELRTPLNPVLLLASENVHDESLPEKTRADFEVVRRNIELEARLIDDLLDLTRISRGKVSLEKRPCDIHAILREALVTVELEIRQKHLILNKDFGADLHVVEGDEVRLQQVFWNILKNAVKFTPDGGTIRVKTSSDANAEKIIIEISDSGLGITPGELGHIFDAFAQGDHSLRSGPHRFGGLGLGLTISRMLVNLHSGMITAVSEGRDRGATFTIQFPCLRLGENRTALSSPASDANGTAHNRCKPASLRVLLVEDHDATRVVLTNLLARRGFEVFSAASVKEAIDVAEHEKLDVVLSDIGLPDGSGYDLMERLRDDFGLKGVALTGYGMEHDVARSQRTGFVSHLIKPVRIEALEKTLADFAQVK